MDDKTLGEELEAIYESATDIQKEEFKKLLKIVQGWNIKSINKKANDRFLALILFRKEVGNGY